MPLLAKARSFFRNLFSFNRRDTDLDQELRSHLEMLIEENIRAGMPFIVYQATPRDPLVLAGVVFAMALIGLLAAWIPAHRALSIDPAILLREE